MKSLIKIFGRIFFFFFFQARSHLFHSQVVVCAFFLFRFESAYTQPFTRIRVYDFVGVCEASAVRWLKEKMKKEFCEATNPESTPYLTYCAKIGFGRKKNDLIRMYNHTYIFSENKSSLSVLLNECGWQDHKPIDCSAKINTNGN